MSINEYDAQVKAGLSNPTPNPETPLRTSIYAASQTTPDRAAAVQQLSAQTKLPASIVDRNFDEINQRHAVDQHPYAQIMEQTPKLATWIAKPDNAAVSRDDLHSLGWMEWLLQKGGDYLKSGVSAVDQYLGSVLSGASTLNETEQRKTGNPLWFMGPTNPGLTTVAAAVKAIGGRSLPAWADPWSQVKKAGDAATQAGAYWDIPDARKGLDTEIARGVAAMAPIILGSMVGGEAVSIPSFFAQGFDSMDKNTRSDNAPQESKNLANVLGGVIMAGTGEFGLGKVLDRVPLNIKNTVLRYLGTVAARGGVQAAVMTGQGILDQVTRHALTNPDAPMFQNLKKEALVGFGTGAIVSGLLGASGGFQARSNAAEQETMFTALGEGVKDSKTFQRLPEALRAFIAHATKDGPVENLNIPVESWQTYWQEKGKDPGDVFNSMTTDGKQKYEEALASGADLSIPTADYATKIAPTEHNAFFAREVKIDPEGMNARQADEFNQKFGDELQRQATEAKTLVLDSPEYKARLKDLTTQVNELTAQIDAPADGVDVAALKLQRDSLVEQQTKFTDLATRIAAADNAQTSAAQVGEDVKGQLVGGSGFDRLAVDAYANLYESVFGTFGARVGVDPHELYAKYGLKIGRPLPDILTKMKNFDEMDLMLNKLRAGEVPTQRDLYGPSLVEFLREKGGLKDEGGDVSSMEPDKGLKPFTRNLVQMKTGLPMDRAREMAAEAGYIPQGESLTEFVDAIDRELRGDPVHSNQAEESPHFAAAQMLDQISSYLKDAGVDLNALTNDQVKKIMADAATLERSGGGLEFAQADEGDKRGSMSFNSDRQFNVELYRRADLSTFLHESGHFYLEVFGDAVDHLKTLEPATLTDTQRQMIADYGSALKWLGVEDRAGIGQDQHEQWARGFEAYLREGKAPSIETRPLFSRFRAWLISIYKSLAQLKVELTPEVTGVMDRLLATDQAIEEAQKQAEITPLFMDQATAGLDDNAWAAYQRTLQDASARAQDAVQQKLMVELQREHEDWWKSERARVRTEVADQVHQRRDYVALSVLQRGTMPDGTEAPSSFKLDRDSIVRQFGKEFLKSLPKPWVYTTEGGMSPDAAAEIFGYDSGAELVHALINAPKMNPFIEAQTDALMRTRHGDMLTDGSLADEAKQAVMTEGRSEVIHAEMRALAAKRREVAPFEKAAVKDAAQAQKEAQQAATDTFSRFVPSVDAVRYMAENRINGMKVKDIRTGVFFAAARNASRMATDAALSQNFDLALAHKQRELLNVEMYRAGLNAKEAIDKAHDQFQKMFVADSKIAKRRNMDFVNAARAIAAQYMFPNQTNNIVEAMDSIRKYDPDLYEVLQEKIQPILTPGTTYKDLTFERFIGMRDTVLSLWAQSRREQQIEIDGKLMDRQEAISALTARTLEFGPAQKIGYAHAVTTWEKTKIHLLGIKASLRRVESWADAMDGGDPHGAFRKYIWTPISEATAKYRIAKADYLTRYMEIVKDVEKSVTHDRIPAPELGYVFSGKSELLHAVLHSGNESNLSKLLRGQYWGGYNYDGTLDTSNWDAFIGRAQRDGILTKSDYDFAQSVWDLLETLKPAAQKAHREMYGHYFNEITANEVKTEFGTYRGGYVPALVDPFKAPDAAIRGEKEAMTESGGSFMYPTTGRGFTKGRVEPYAKPLALDLGYIPSHIDKVLKFVNIEPRVKDVARILFDRKFRETINGHDPTVAGDMLVPWLQRAASQRISSAGKGWGGKAADAFFNTVRQRVGLQQMAANVTNTLTQLHGLTLSALQVKPTSLAGALWDYVRAPQDTAAMITDKSDFMKTRMTSQQMEIQKTIDNILLNPSLYEKSRDWIHEHAYLMQHLTHGVVGTIAWTGAYNEAVAAGETEAGAVRRADSVVRETQGSFAPEDVSRFEASSPMARAFSMFYSYFNMQANLLTTEFGKIATGEMGLRKGAGRALYVYALGFMVPSLVYDGVRAMMAGGIDHKEDDSYLVDMLGIFFGSQFKSLGSMVPVVGPFVSAGVGAFTKSPTDDDIRVSPAISILQSAVHAPADVYKAIQKRELTGNEIKDVMTMIGLLSGVPTGPVSNALRYQADRQQGKVAQPANAFDAARGYLSGTGPRQ